MEYGIVGVLVLIASIYAIYNVFSSSASGGKKIAWTIGILIFPVLGFIVWLLAGPRATTASA